MTPHERGRFRGREHAENGLRQDCSEALDLFSVFDYETVEYIEGYYAAWNEHHGIETPRCSTEGCENTRSEKGLCYICAYEAEAA